MLNVNRRGQCSLAFPRPPELPTVSETVREIAATRYEPPPCPALLSTPPLHPDTIQPTSFPVYYPHPPLLHHGANHTGAGSVNHFILPPRWKGRNAHPLEGFEPYLFTRQANSLRITDKESVTRSAGPMLAYYRALKLDSLCWDSTCRFHHF